MAKPSWVVPSAIAKASAGKPGLMTTCGCLQDDSLRYGIRGEGYPP